MLRRSIARLWLIAVSCCVGPACAADDCVIYPPSQDRYEALRAFHDAVWTSWTQNVAGCYELQLSSMEGLMFERRVVTVRTPEGKLRLILLIGREHFVGPGPETDSDFPNLSVEYKLDLYRYYRTTSWCSTTG